MTPAGRVGFFWLVPGTDGGDAVLLDALELDAAEAYGDVLTHPGGHYDFWEELRGRGAKAARSLGVSPSALSREYEEWPRGRVVFDAAARRFRVYADRRILVPGRLALVASAFGLAEGSFDAATDPHYR